MLFFYSISFLFDNIKLWSIILTMYCKLRHQNRIHPPAKDRRHFSAYLLSKGQQIILLMACESFSHML